MGQILLISEPKSCERAGDVIFVHGLDGDARSTWTAKDSASTFWPEWLGADLAGVCVWSLEYEAASLSWKGTGMPLVDRAANILDLCTTYDIGSRPLIFIAHSLGGLLVKQLLRCAKEYNNAAWAPFAINTRGIVFLATPHSGSDKADWLEAFGTILRPNVTVHDLRAHAPQLRDLNLWYRNNAAQMGITTKVYYESRKYRGLLIVDPTTADPGIHGVFPIQIDADHSSICKLDKKDQRYRGILQLIRDSVIRGDAAPQRSTITFPDQANILGGLPSRWAAQVDAFRFQYIGIPSSPVPFGGRQKQLEMLSDWLNDASAPQYGLLEARAGLGKSALLVRWVDTLLQTASEYDIIYFPISARWQTNSELAVFEALTFRLASLFEEPAPHTEAVRELRDVMRNYLDRIVESSRRLLLVLDGLDEAADWKVDTDFLPPRSRGNLRALVAARTSGEGSRSWLGRLGWSTRGVARSFRLDELNRDEVADALRQAGSALATLLGRQSLVDALFEKSQGDPLVLSLYINELERYIGSAETFDEHNLQRIEPGLRGFFRYWLEDQERLWGEGRHELEPRVRAMISLCALAYGPLMQEDVLGIKPDLFDETRAVERTAQDLERLVIGDGRRQGYVFSHPRLGEFVREDVLGATERLEYYEAFLNYGKRAVEKLRNCEQTQVPEYVVRWYSTHLVESGSPSAWLEPLLDARWCAQWERIDGTPAGFLSDLEKAFRQSNGKHELSIPIRASILCASVLSRRAISRELFHQCVAADILSPALAEVIARQQELASGQCSYLRVLATHIGRDRERLLREAVTAARKVGHDHERARALAAVAECLGPEDQEVLKEVLGLARDIGPDSARAAVLGAVAERFYGEERKKVLREALSASREIQDDESRAEALCRIAKRLERSESEKIFQEARSIARHIEDDFYRAHALSDVAQHLSADERREALQEALAAAFQIDDDFDRASTLNFIVGKLNGEDRELLQSILTRASQLLDSGRALVLRAVVKCLDGENRDLLRQVGIAARSIGSAAERDSLLGAVAGRLGADGRQLLHEGIAVARRIEYDSGRAAALLDLATNSRGEDREQLLQEALGAARQIRYEHDRADTLLKIAGECDLRGIADLTECLLPIVHRPGALPIIACIAKQWRDFCRLRKADAREEINLWLHHLSRSARSHVMSALTNMIPAIEAIDGMVALSAMARAIVDAGRWWP
jgi:hypothetical protein